MINRDTGMNMNINHANSLNKGVCKMKKYAFFVVLISVTFWCYTNMASAQNITIKPEKPLIIKGLYIGMDIQEAKKVTEQILGKDWKVGPVGEKRKILADYRFGDEEIFGGGGKDYLKISITGDSGFAIINKDDYYCGFVSNDRANNKVTRISFNDRLTNYIFSISNIDVHDFVEAFRNNYSMPEFNWIMQGWTYSSPKGYTIRIMTNKLIDIKKFEYQEQQLNKPKIKFD